MSVGNPIFSRYLSDWQLAHEVYPTLNLTKEALFKLQYLHSGVLVMLFTMQYSRSCHLRSDTDYMFLGISICFVKYSIDASISGELYKSLSAIK